MDPITIAMGLAQFAPQILKFFGVGDKPVAVAEKVIEIAQSVTGAKTPEEAMASMRENAQFAHEFQLAVMQNDEKLEELYLADRKDARARDVEIVKAKGNNFRGDMLAFGAIGALLLCIFLLFVREVPQQSRDLLLVTLGALVAIVKDVYGFEFGSSKDSQRNAQAVVNQLNGNGH